MKVILIADDPALGTAGQVLQVKDGFARNYLIPQKKALPATPENLRKFEQMRKSLEAARAKAKSTAQALAHRIEKLELTFVRQAGEGDKLFGSVTTMDLERALGEKGVEIDRKRILLQEPIKSLGDFQVPVKLHPEVTAVLKVKVLRA
ncbi:MAG: 50S ribosomal protein L9 [Thermodesulfobacteriota bacterium]